MVQSKAFWFKLNKYKILLFMLLPAFLYFLVFSYLPMAGAVIAFKNYTYNGGIFGSPWASFDNFKFFFISGQAIRVTMNTILYNLAFLILNTSLQIIIAVVLAEIGSKYFRMLTQSMMFIPYFISWVIVGAIVYNIFNFNFGMLNGTLRSLGLEPIDVYGQPKLWIIIIILFSAWKWAGYGSILYLAAIMGIDTEMFEAAELDGANTFQRIWNITLPSLVPTLIVLSLLSISHVVRGDFGMFYQLIGDNGTLYDTTDVIDTFVFRSLMRTQEFGMSAAAGLYQSVLCFIIIMATNFTVKKINKEYALF